MQRKEVLELFTQTKNLYRKFSTECDRLARMGMIGTFQEDELKRQEDKILNLEKEFNIAKKSFNQKFEKYKKQSNLDIYDIIDLLFINRELREYEIQYKRIRRGMPSDKL